MHPFRPPFGVPARRMNPNTTQPQHPYNLQDLDPSVLTYAAYLSGSQPSQQQAEPNVDVVSETQPEPVPEKSKRGRRSHKKKEKDEPRRTKTVIKWTKEEEFTLTRAWLDVSEDHETGFVHSFLARGVKANIGTKIPFLAKWTDINNKCHAFQEVYQRNYDNRPSGEGDVGVSTKTLDEFEKTKCPFPYYKCWDLLRKSPKWALVGTMTSSSKRRAKRSKTSSSVDPETPTSDARNVDLNELVDVDEKFEEELTRPPGRRKDKRTGKKTAESSSDLELKEDFEEMNRHLQDIRDLGHKR
ncbi:putative No apical meristem-associated domain-containing protein [Helianthus annuus]|uniref:No apical meristem-associated domain-containing protein n=1 Tax=Helianthus annuus TaxID=4232 RepID=A0A9K3N5Z0_HELAN|nr:putative No apical meristem-associated domain-containing protein [Helianthus annuus]KAJ0515231.1 putative No apical meristem-associated domain-containing protein [Helianthus annuus]KAJ0523689.1 putative No apical meristem-associated domain-containing protein [Helianthus annuus]KAJ0531423.1 putative No apical meristem-associated domain-containing protein [Helianthus annuus]KAJ0698266.1 putative No apical meristem-associated domain-containing protein [Helianthus annuus]